MDIPGDSAKRRRYIRHSLYTLTGLSVILIGYCEHFTLEANRTRQEDRGFGVKNADLPVCWSFVLRMCEKNIWLQ
jgi:hypothetical protein